MLIYYVFFLPVTVGFHEHWLQPVLVKQEFGGDQFVSSHFVGRSQGQYKKRNFRQSGPSSFGPGSFPCTKCGKVYNWRGNLLRHMRLECGKAPQFHCSYCPYMTKHKNHLQRHMMTRHRDVLEYCQISCAGNRWGKQQYVLLPCLSLCCNYLFFGCLELVAIIVIMFLPVVCSYFNFFLWF
jgi:hypothetical protein